MFSRVAIDGSTSFVADQSYPINCDSFDEETVDEEEDQLTPLSISTKRASSTSMTASNPSKRSKSPGVRTMENNMRGYNDIARHKLTVLQNIWQERNQLMQDNSKTLERKIAHVQELARQCGATEETPSLWLAMLKII
jgi:hypothetical protein